MMKYQQTGRLKNMKMNPIHYLIVITYIEAYIL